MYMDVLFANPAGVVPKQAIQSLGSTSVVYLLTEGEPGRFIQRAGKTGEESSTGARVLEGLKPSNQL